MQSELVIGARGVTKAFGTTQVLRGIDLDVPPGITGLLGSNGAGKTTLLSLILGVEPRNAGTMAVLGHDPQTAGPEVRARIGYSPEHHHLPGDVQAFDLVRHLAQLHGLPQQASSERASDALWLVGLGEERFRPIGTMSTGQRQRVKLAAAVAHDPSLVLLDEPTDGLDPVQRDSMLELIDRISNVYGISVLLSSHLLDEVDQICDHVVIIADGLVRRAGAIGELRGAGTAILVELDDCHDAVAATLTALGFIVQRSGNRLLVDLAPGTALPNDYPFLVHDHIGNAIAEHGAGLRRMTEHTLSLEDVYFESSLS